ncbi:MAG: ABC transporter substrate-binding protein [Candidatus Sumerlaeaceae bacterium]
MVAALAIVLLTGCGEKRATPGDEAAKPGDQKPAKVFNYVNTDEPKHLDPAFSYDVYEGIASGLLFDGLVNFGKGTETVPALAQSWEISEDGTSYTFHLREAKFSNGAPVTSADVQYSFSRLLWPETNSDRKYVVEEIAGADAVSGGTTHTLQGLSTPDPKTVLIKLRRPYQPFLMKLAMPSGAIIPENSAGTARPSQEFEKNPVGTGPWVLDKWEHDQRLEFRRNEHYWGERPKVDRFVYNVQVDDSVQRQLYKLGKIDQYTPGFAVYLQWIKDPEAKAALVKVPEMNTYFFAFNNSKPALKDKRVRQAISHAINTTAIFEKLQLSRGAHAFGPVPDLVQGYRPELKPRAYDPEKAKALLAEAGVKDLTISLWERTEAQTDEMCAAAKADLGKIGVHVNILRRDIAAFREAVYNGEPDMYYYSWWLDYPDIENALEPSFHSKNIPRKGNGCRYNNPEFDKLIDAAVAEADPQKRIQMFQQAEDMIIEDCPWVFLYHRRSDTAIQKWVKHFEPELLINASKCTDIDIDIGLKGNK